MGSTETVLMWSSGTLRPTLSIPLEHGTNTIQLQNRDKNIAEYYAMLEEV